MYERLFDEHLDCVLGHAEQALLAACDAPMARGRRSPRESRRAFDGIVFHAGRLRFQHADDLAHPHRPVPHFARLAPIVGPDHLLVYEPGVAPRLVRVVPEDFWHAPASALEPFVADALEVCEVASPEAALAQVGRRRGFAYVGSDPEVAAALGIGADGVEPPSVVASLDWDRAIKTPFEVACIREAVRRASVGHRVLRRAIASGPSEFALHLEYLAASDQLDTELPYPSIIAWDAHAATLHHEARDREKPMPGSTFLVDAGARCCGYASDLTRSYIRAAAPPHPAFSALLDGIEALQRRCVAEVRPRRSYVDLHRFAEEEIGALLAEVGILRAGKEEIRDRGLVRPFFPHGLGHHLGLQVHDVGGLQSNREGEIEAPPDDCPNLRTTRRLEPGHVVTIEPGLYFIAKLLEPHRAGVSRDAIDWGLVDALTAFGGIRIEDDVLVTQSGAEDLSRPWLPGHLEDVSEPEPTRP